MKRYLLLLTVPVLLLLWWGVSRGKSVPVVHFATVRTLTIQSTVSTNGKVEPAQWAAARAEIAGVVKTIRVQRGQTVSAGETLVKLDSVGAQSELAAAQAKEQEARAESSTLGQGGRPGALAGLNDSVATAHEAVKVAQRNYDGFQRLQSQQAATRLQVDEASDALRRAKLQLSAAENQQRTLVTSSDRTVAQARLLDAQAAVSLAKDRLSRTIISAPISGTVYEFDLKLGAYLQPGQQVALVGNLDQVKVIVYVDEPDLGRIRNGMPVEISWDARPGQRWQGQVKQMPTEVVALGSRTVGEVTTSVDNPGHDLFSGVSVNATIISEVIQNAPAIPKAALRIKSGRNGVYRLGPAQTLEWTSIKTGVTDINNIQVLSGLKNGENVADRVVQPSDTEMGDGMRVKPVFE